MDAAFLSGLVFAVFFGMAAGNYATNPIYRLPRQEPLFGRKPYCGDCNAELKPKDLFPIFSWLLTKGKCRYCGACVPPEYFLAETWVTVVFTLAYLRFGFSEPFLLIAFGLTGFIMLAMMEVIDRFFSWVVAGWIGAFALVLSALELHSIYPALAGGFYAGFAALAIWKLSPSRHVSMPNYVTLAALVGMWLRTDLTHYAWFAAVAPVTWVVLGKVKEGRVSLAAACGLCAALLYSQ